MPMLDANRTDEFAGGVTSHVRKYQSVGNLYHNESTLNPVSQGQNGLANADFGQRLAGIRTSPNGVSSDTFSRNLQKNIPYINTFGG